MTQPFDFSGRNVFVMGGTSGINLGIAEAFAAGGAQLGVASRSKEKVDAAIARLSVFGKPAAGFSADVRDADALSAGLKEIGQQWDRIDILIVGQAGNFPAPAAAMSSNAFKSVVDIDLLGTFNVIRHAHAFLARPGACIINISAPQAFIPMELQVHVCAAKAGVDMITRALALEWGRDGIRVNSIVPGPIEGTEGMRRLAPTEELRTMVSDSVPLRRWGRAQDIANCAMFLASPLGDYISGAVIPVDGGWSLGGASMRAQELARFFEKHARDSGTQQR